MNAGHLIPSLSGLSPRAIHAGMRNVDKKTKWGGWGGREGQETCRSHRDIRQLHVEHLGHIKRKLWVRIPTEQLDVSSRHGSRNV